MDPIKLQAQREELFRMVMDSLRNEGLSNDRRENIAYLVGRLESVCEILGMAKMKEEAGRTSDKFRDPLTAIVGAASR